MIIRVLTILALLGAGAALAQGGPGPIEVQQPGINSPFVATGGNKPITAANRAAFAVNVKDFGACGDDTCDDSAAINAALAYVRTLPSPTSSAQGSGISALVKFPIGTYKIAASGINATGLRSLNIVFDMEGATIDCQVTGGVCFDAIYSQFLRFNSLSIVGSATNTPSIGFQDGRKGTESSDTIYLDRPTITGQFTLAALYNFASELNTIVHPALYNSYPSSSSYVMLLDGINHWNVGSAFQTITAPSNTAQSFTKVVVLGGSIMNVSTSGGYALGMSNVAAFSFLETYMERSSTGNAVYIYSSPSWPVSQFTCTCHFEPSTLQNLFYIDGPTSTLNAQLRGFRFTDEYPEMSNAIFKLSTNVGYAVLTDMDIHIDNYLASGAKVFDNPALWYVDGKYADTAGGYWNAPATFQGMLEQHSIITTTQGTISLIPTNPGNGGSASITFPGFNNYNLFLGPLGDAGNGVINLGAPLVVNGGLTVGNGGFTPSITAASGPLIAKSPISVGATTFTISGCSATTPTGTGTTGTFVSGTNGTCTVVVTLNGATGMTATHGWTGYANDETTPANVLHVTAHSTTTITYSGTTASGDTISFHADPY